MAKIKKRKSTNKKNIKIPDIKSLIFGKPPELSGASESHNKNTIPIKDIRDGIVITTDNRYIKILEILPVNFYLKSIIEQQNIIHYFSNYLKIAPSNLQILVRTGKANIDAYCERMENLYYKEENENCKNMIQENAELVNYLAENEAVTRRFYLVFQAENGGNSYDAVIKELEEQTNNAAAYLDYCGLEVVRHKDYNSFLINLFQSLSNSEQDYDFLNPSIDITHNDYITVNGVYHSYLYITGYGYNTHTYMAWLAPFVEMGDGISFNFTVEKLRKEKILPKIIKTTMLNRSRMRDIGDTRTDFEQLDDAIASGMYMKDEMNRNGEEFYYMNTIIEVTANDEETLKRRISQVETMCTSMDIAVKRTSYKHKEAFLSSLPLLSLDTDLKKMSKRNVLTMGVAGAFPFSSFELCDSTGSLLGINRHNNSAVIVDFFDTYKYSNANLSIMGMSGAGKTFLLQLLTLRLRMQDVQVFIIAPLKGWEFKKACEAIGGKYIKLSPGSDDCINIMEIRRTSLNIDNDIKDNGRRDSVLADKAQKLHIFFSLLYPNISAEDKHKLDAAIIETYNTFGITHDNNSLFDENKNIKTMPTLRDLHAVLMKNPETQKLGFALNMLVNGSASKLGGSTNVDLNNKYIVLDISEMGKEMLPLGMFLALDFVWDEAKKSRVQKKAVCLDEVWELIGSGANELAADFVLEIFKIIRGLGGMAVAATQDLVDFFALSDGKYGKGILNNCRTKIVLQLEEDEAQTVKKYLALSDEETLQIIRSSRGQGLLCAGRNRISVEFKSNLTEYRLISAPTNEINL